MIRREVHDDSGFTLVELLVAIVIEAVIVAALGMAFINILNGTTSVNQSLSRSGDARIAAAYVVSDARSSSGPQISLTTSTCADANPPVAGGTLVVQFGSSSTAALTGVSTAHVVDYFLASNKLMRRECKNSVLVSDRIVASNVQTATAACSPNADCSGAPTSITITITETPDSNGNSYVYKLTGTFRDVTSPPTNPRSVVLLGASGACSGSTDTIGITGSASMRVYGDAFINTTDGTSCNAMDLQNSGVWKAGGTNIFTGGTCVDSGSSVCPTVTTTTTRVADPYANLTAPSTSGLPAQTGCTGGQSSQTAQPGLYSGGFNLGGGDTCTLSSGIYVVQGGFNVGNGATLKTGSGGVLIYLMTGQFNINGGASITLTAMTSGTYTGLVFWQAAADTQPIVFSNGGALVFNGAIYGPKAQLQITGNAQTPIVTALVIQTIALSNSGGITVGAASTTPLSIPTPATLGPGTVSTAFSVPIAAAGGDGNYVWSATGLPAGLTIDASSGVISGTPTATGSSSVTVKLNDLLGDDQATKAYTLVINPAPTIVSVALTNKTGGVAGKMEAGDKITVVYSSTMKVSSFCSSWTTGDAANQSLTGNTVLVNVSNGTTDAITVTNSSGCAFNFGSINLASNAYVTADATFGGASGNTAIAWTASSKTLVITLGALASGAVGTVATTTSPIYTAPAAITDSNGATIGNSPFTITPSAVRF